MPVLLLYFLSGATGLVLETVFLRQASWVFGSAAASTSIVIAAFVGGLAAGSAAFGAVADRVRRPLLLYGVLEIGAGISAAGLVALFAHGRDWLLAPIRVWGPGTWGTGIEIALALALFVVPTALMGGTLPALARLTVRDPAGLLGPVALLYGVNTLGAALGTLGAGFFLIEALGVSRTAYAAAGLDVAIGAAAIALARRPDPFPPAVPRGKPKRAALPQDEGAAPAVRAACLAASALCGASVLGYEVVWTRMLSVPMKSYVYSFALMLALFLAGLVIGSLLVAGLGARVRRPAALLGSVLLGMGAYTAVSVLWLPSLLVPHETRSFAAFLARGAAYALPVVIPPTILSGMALPLAMRGFAPAAATIGRGVGRVYAANTLGGIAGALAAGLALLPAVGAPRALGLLAVANVGAGAIVLGSLGPRRRAWAAAGAVALSALPLLAPPERFLRTFLEASRDRRKMGSVLHFHEGATDTVAIVEREYGFFDPGVKSLITNGIAMSGTGKPARRYMAAEGHLPVLLAPSPSRALVVCIGTGITLGAIVSHPALQAIDAVDLSEGVLDGLPRFDADNDRSYLDPRVRVYHEDGRHFLETRDVGYDVITLEPPPPIVAGSVHLYSAEFYRTCRRRLREGGVLAQWLPLHAESDASAKMAARTFLDAFPYAQLWLPSARDAVLVGSARPLRLEEGRLLAAFREPRTAANLRAAYLETPEALLATFLLDRAGIESWCLGAPLVTDERPRMEFFRNQGLLMDRGDILALAATPQSSWDWIAGLDPERRAAVLSENRAFRTHLEADLRGDKDAAARAARASRGTEYYLYWLGCAADQIAYLREHPGEGPPIEDQLRSCRASTGP